MIIKYPIRVIFGTGDILTGIISATDKKNKKKYYGVGLSQVEPGKVGRCDDKYKDMNILPAVELLFPSVESIDVFMHQLEIVRNDLKIADAGIKGSKAGAALRKETHNEK